MSRAKQKISASVSPASNGLPPGWLQVPIGAVTIPKVEQHEPAGKGEFCYVDIGSVDNQAKIIVEPKTIPVAKAPSRARQLIRTGDVLASMTRPNLNAVALVPKRLDGAIASTGFDVLRSNGAVLPQWLFLLVRSKGFVDAMTDLVQGALYPAVRPANIRDFQFPLPPLAEQRRIMARLEKLAARSRRARAALDAVPQLLAQARQSFLAAAFRGDLTKDWRNKHLNLEPGTSLVKILEAAHADAGGHKRGNAAQATEGVHNLTPADFPPTWGLTDLLNLCSPGKPVTYGILMPGPDQPNGVPYVRVADYPGEVINLKTVRRTTKEIEYNFARARLSTGDLLLSIRGSVGRMAIVPPELNGGNITQDTVRLSITAEIETAFVEYMLRAPATLARMQQATKGVAVRGINVGDVRALQIPMPPIPEQREIVRRLKRATAHLDAATAAHASAVAELDRLDQSLLARAFTGQLVPQNPQDEPAAKLLERIKQNGQNHHK